MSGRGLELAGAGQEAFRHADAIFRLGTQRAASVCERIGQWLGSRSIRPRVNGEFVDSRMIATLGTCGIEPSLRQGAATSTFR